MSNEEQNSNFAKPMLIILEELSNAELLQIVDEFQKEVWEDDSIVRTLAKQFFGGDSLTQIMFVPLKVLPVIAERVKGYSFPDNVEIRKWWQTQKFQKEQGEQEYTMIYEIDLPKILKAFVERFPNCL